MKTTQPMTLDNIFSYLQSPPPRYINPEIAVCYILAVLLEGDSYGSHLVKQISKTYPTYRLSETVLYSAITFLIEEGLIISYQQKAEGRGRPRQMYRLKESAQGKARELAQMGTHYLSSANLAQAA
ncbi:PadR family transcriptional regulator [Leptolyngbya sp. AN03gr2]|uniref:PadR family transcriptional regulator n=1 Tax=unclassified Leptolyngbya TaxID=2650499 RepID=UPI003D3152FE